MFLYYLLNLDVKCLLRFLFSYDHLWIVIAFGDLKKR